MGGKNSGSKEAKQARKDEQARQAQIRQGTDSINSTFDNQFNDNFFDAQRQNYSDFATPQLQQQYQDAGKDLTFSLARSGLLNSSARAQQEGRLQQLYDTNAQDIADKALSYESDARNNVEDARSNLITTLNATGDAQGAANSAIARASALSTAPSYSALGQLFTDFTGTLNTAAAQQKAAAASVGAYSPSTAGLYGNAGKVTVSR